MRQLTERTMHHGEYRLISELLREGHGFKLEAWGCEREGWAPYLVDADGIGLRIGDVEKRSLRRLRQDAGSHYGTVLRLCRRSFHGVL